MLYPIFCGRSQRIAWTSWFGDNVCSYGPLMRALYLFTWFHSIFPKVVETLLKDYKSKQEASNYNLKCYAEFTSECCEKCGGLV